ARVPDPVSMLYGSMEPNERFRARRDQARRRRRRRRATAVGAVLVGVLAFGAGWQFRPSRTHAATARQVQPIVRATPPTTLVSVRPRPLPVEIRGVHVTGALASLPGKLGEYAALRGQGLNTIVLDIKDEGGVVSFSPRGVTLADAIGAVRHDYDPKAVA